MSEEVRPFEEYKEMIKDMRKEEMIKGLYDLSANIMKKQKEIERLNKENKELKEQVVSAIRVNNICTENKSFVELQAQRYEQELTITKEKQLKEEIERLNNIINELEKWLEESIEKRTEDYLDWKYDRNVYLAGSKKLQNVFDKLQELKGSNDNG